mgnify:CR=1 FL=1
MAAENYDKCLELILHHEGGYVNHPKDPGGETNLGVTKRVYEEWGGTKDTDACKPIGDEVDKANWCRTSLFNTHNLPQNL